MKTFLEWMESLKLEWSWVVGEDEEAPFSAMLSDHGEEGWSIHGSLWAKDYVPNGTENPVSQPQYRSGANFTGTEFKNPGERLENIHEPLRSQALKWIDNEHLRNFEREVDERPSHIFTGTAPRE
jgi:hypothetical protein